MKNIIKWSVLGLLLAVVFITAMMKPPAEITAILTVITSELTGYSAFVHILCLVVLAAGLAVRKLRTFLFTSLIAFLALSATVISVMNMILPNSIMFATVFVLIVSAAFKQKLRFDFERLKPLNLFFGAAGILFGFWYLHWVADPVWLNALLYSPLGVVNCPTMVMICAFLCLTVKPRSVILETAAALITLYFGFFGIFRLGAYVDIVLIICALFLLFRLSSYAAWNAEKAGGVRENSKARP